MSLKLLLDENISPVVAQGLSTVGYDAVHVRSVGLKGKKDEEILAELKPGALVVSSSHSYRVRQREPDA